MGNTSHLSAGNGTVVEQYLYDAYGQPSVYDGTGNARNGSAYDNRYLFKGAGAYEWIAPMGTYYARARFYLPFHGRWLQPDPIGQKGGLNIYSYCGNDPLNKSDPTGLDTYLASRTIDGALGAIATPIFALFGLAPPTHTFFLNIPNDGGPMQSVGFHDVGGQLVQYGSDGVTESNYDVQHLDGLSDMKWIGNDQLFTQIQTDASQYPLDSLGRYDLTQLWGSNSNGAAAGIINDLQAKGLLQNLGMDGTDAVNSLYGTPVASGKIPPGMTLNPTQSLPALNVPNYSELGALDPDSLTLANQNGI